MLFEISNLHPELQKIVLKIHFDEDAMWPEWTFKYNYHNRKADKQPLGHKIKT